mgnify:CR=1 FL=1
MNNEQELLRKKSPVQIKNKKASFEYFFIETYTAGIVLTGTEIKSIRQSRVSLADTFCFITNGEMWIKNMYVAPYFYGSYNNPVARRDRKLLLNKKEIRRLQTDLKNPGQTVVPVKLFIDDNGRAKLEIALARGKKQYDKRQSMKDRSDKREMDRSFKEFNH